jgi:thiamine-monophosphate kinase
LKPEARKDIIDFFEDINLQPTSMIDVSDGISSDILHICSQSKVGCEIFEDELPIVDETAERALTFNLDPTTCAMNGGEDYELLFTIDEADETKLADVPGISIIGKIVEKEDGCLLVTKGGNRVAITAQGWNHFSSSF